MKNAPDPLFELHTGSSLRPADDLISLKQHVPGGQFRYVDIATEQARTLAHKRWPLLAELDSHARRPGKPTPSISTDPSRAPDDLQRGDS